jgi:hypothetical protein
MPPCPPAQSYLLLLALSVLLAACGTPRAAGRFGPRQYAQTTDSATSACLRNPACYNPPYGESPILPWLSRSLEAGRTAAAVLRLLEAAEIEIIEQVLADCANQASNDVNERLLGKGQRPTRELCDSTYAIEKGGRKVTWAMHLGREKHQAALECVQQELGKKFPDNLRLQPTYRYDRKTGRLEFVAPSQVDEWLREGLFGKLLGTLVPDVVIHAAGDLLNIQAVFDFKFPCPPHKPALWHEYHENHPFHSTNQKEIYREAFKVDPNSVRPAFGVGP